MTRAASAGSSAVIGFSFSQTQQNLNYQASSNSVNATTGSFSGAITSTNTSLTIGASSAAGNQLHVRYAGFFKSNLTVGGTLTPQFAQSAAPSSGNPTANIGSYFRLVPMGAGYPVISGDWS
jgi:hypothetical protein